jgi:serine/threonine protein kinase
VERLIANAACEFLGTDEAGRSWDAALGLCKGDVVGSYRIVSVLGEGGFGVVYQAERMQPFAQRVALKVIKPGMDSRAILARFEQERQAIALLDHPSVARVFDGGVTAPEQGRLPYFAMEFVEGQPITTYADRRHLGVRDRIELLIEVCSAVHHAHTRGILHRDLKPSNIIASGLADRHAVKVIDFGVAKALTGKLTDASIHTLEGAMMGTPGYMSPEQARTSGTDVDTRTDVYAIGVVLYELLTGAQPFGVETLFRDGLLGAQRIIAETNPPRPSARFAQLESDQRREIAQNRDLDERALLRTLQGDLDWIVLKCLEKDRERRYSSASELAGDLRRYLDMQPVEAGPPSTRYRAGKFVRRNRLAVGAAIVVVAGLSAGLVGVSVGLIRAREALASEQRARASEEAATALARQEADLSGAISAFLVDDLLGAPRPSERGPDVTVRELLDEARTTMSARFAEKPHTEAGIRYAVGRAYLALGLLQPAREELRPAYESMLRLHGPEDRRTFDAMKAYVGVLWRDGDSEAALAVLDQASTTLPSDRLLELLDERASALKHANKPEDAAPLYALALEVAIAQHGERSEQALAARYNIALNEEKRGNIAEAHRVFEQTLTEIRKSLPPGAPLLYETLSEYARFSSRSLGDRRLAEPMYREAVEGIAKKHGDQHWRTAQLRANFAVFLMKGGDDEAAIPYFDACFVYYTTDDTNRARRDGPAVLRYYSDALKAVRGDAAAIEMLRSAIDASTLARGADDPSTMKFADLLDELMSNAP